MRTLSISLEALGSFESQYSTSVLVLPLMTSLKNVLPTTFTSVTGSDDTGSDVTGSASDLKNWVILCALNSSMNSLIESEVI